MHDLGWEGLMWPAFMEPMEKNITQENDTVCLGQATLPAGDPSSKILGSWDYLCKHLPYTPNNSLLHPTPKLSPDLTAGLVETDQTCMVNS